MQDMATSFELIGYMNHTICKETTSTLSILNLNKVSVRNLGYKCIYKLDIEKFRYTSKGNILPPEQIICKYCTRNEIEDETHFLIVCPLYYNANL